MFRKLIICFLLSSALTRTEAVLALSCQRTAEKIGFAHAAGFAGSSRILVVAFGPISMDLTLLSVDGSKILAQRSLSNESEAVGRPLSFIYPLSITSAGNSLFYDPKANVIRDVEITSLREKCTFEPPSKLLGPIEAYAISSASGKDVTVAIWGLGIGSSKSVLSIYQSGSCRKLGEATIDLPASSASRLSVSSDGKLVAFTFYKESLRRRPKFDVVIWNLELQKLVGEIDSKQEVSDVAFGAAHELYLAKAGLSKESSLEIWDADTAKLRSRLPKPEWGAAHRVAVSRDGRQVFGLSLNEQLHGWGDYYVTVSGQRVSSWNSDGDLQWSQELTGKGAPSSYPELIPNDDGTRLIVLDGIRMEVFSCAATSTQ